MDGTLLIWTMLGGVGALIVALFVVMVARGMDGKKPAAAESEEGDLSRAVTDAFNAVKAAKAGDKAQTTESTKKAVSGFVAAGAGIAVLGAVIAFVKDFNDGRVAPVISEISAGELRGTMVNARNSDPVVLIVPGSGPTDRDGNGPAGLNTDAYKLLADGLIKERIASVRIDKRGMFGSKAAGDPNAVSPDIYAADIHAWIDAIKATRGEGSGCIFLLGHSEGALMVSLAAEGRKDVCGLILVAGMGRPMGTVIREQLNANPANAPLLPQAMAALEALEAGRDVDVTGMHPALLPLFAPQVQPYLKSVINVDPVEAVRRANKQTLVIQGKTDLQITVADAHLLNKAPKTKLQLIDGMNHVLKKTSLDRAANLATYSDLSLPLAPKLVRRIEDFVKDND